MIKQLFTRKTLLVFICCFTFSAGNLYAVGCADLIFTSMTITAINTGSPKEYVYNFQVKNIGSAPITMGQVSVQHYVSSDNQYDGGDPAAGGGPLAYQSSVVLQPNETFNGSYAAYPGSNSQALYPYLIANIFTTGGATECSTANNQFSILIQVATSTQSANTAIATIIWNAESKSFSVSDWSGNGTSLQYNVYNTSGMLVHTGNTTEDSSTPLTALTGGAYILYLSDGQKIYSQKIVY